MKKPPKIVTAVVRSAQSMTYPALYLAIALAIDVRVNIGILGGLLISLSATILVVLTAWDSLYNVTREVESKTGFWLTGMLLFLLFGGELILIALVALEAKKFGA